MMEKGVDAVKVYPDSKLVIALNRIMETASLVMPSPNTME